MPIETAVEICAVDQRRFHDLDTLLMKIAFELQNTLGNLCDERIYQGEFSYRSRQMGIFSQREVQVRVSHESFAKSYYLDILVERGVIYEFKTAEALTPAHHVQLLQYLMLTNLKHGKLVNFRPQSVEARFVSTQLTRPDRMRYRLYESSWYRNGKSDLLKAALTALLSDWGAFLSISLYREALLHLLEGPGAGLFPVPILIGDRVAGNQTMCMLDDQQAWHLSAFRSAGRFHEDQIHRMLKHTPVKFLHWINLHHHEITLKTLRK